MKNVSRFVPAAALFVITAAAPAASFAQTSASSTPVSNISNEYSDFLTNVNSQQVVNDLRNGQWTTTTTDPNTNVTTTTTESLPTGKMGHGNVRISFALARYSLSKQGIYQPTSDQLHTALVGGHVNPTDPNSATMEGILQMRADGMGWGQIAQKYDVKLGPLMSGKQPAATATTTDTNTTTTSSKGIVTGRGKSASEGALNATSKGNGKTLAGSKAQGSGIVSGSGKSAGTSNFVSHGSRGIVSGSGRSVGHTSGIVTGGGHGHQYGASGASHGNGGGHGKGHSK